MCSPCKESKFVDEAAHIGLEYLTGDSWCFPGADARGASASRDY